LLATSRRQAEKAVGVISPILSLLKWIEKLAVLPAFPVRR
jgi:hypothetical protein